MKKSGVALHVNYNLIAMDPNKSVIKRLWCIFADILEQTTHQVCQLLK